MKEQSRKQKWLNSMGKSQNLTLIVTGPVLTIFNPIWPKTRTPKDINKFNQFYNIYQNSRKGLFVFFLCLIVMVWTIAEAFCLPSLFLWDWPEISALKSKNFPKIPNFNGRAYFTGGVPSAENLFHGSPTTTLFNLEPLIGPLILVSRHYNRKVVTQGQMRRMHIYDAKYTKQFSRSLGYKVTQKCDLVRSQQHRKV